MNREKGLAHWAGVAALCLLVAGGTSALANTVWHVSTSAPNTICSSASTFTCNTINGAVSGAGDYDIIVVGPGKYTESVLVNKRVQIFGAQAGVDARDRRQSGESIVDATNQGGGPGSGAAFYLADLFVAIDGFTIQGGTSGSNAAGVFEGNYFTTQINNNIIQNNAVGICLDMIDTGYNTVIEHNLIRNNNTGTAGSAYSPGLVPGVGFGIASYFADYGLTISENAFEGNLAAAMFIYNGASGTFVTGNTSNNDGSFLVLDDNGYGIMVTGNAGQNFGAKGFRPIVRSTNASAAIELLYSNGNGLNISDNTLWGGKASGYSGIDFSALLDVNGHGPDFAGKYCSVTNNRITHFAGNGIVAEPYSSDGTLYLCQITHNHIADNGGVGILIGNAPRNSLNQVMDNQVEGNHVYDCEDDTSGTVSGTPPTDNTWFNNSPGVSSPSGLCGPGARAH
jgi:hypothetical protein